MPMYPPAAPVASGSTLTVSMLVNNPPLLRKRISDTALRKDYLGLIFADNGLNTSGATGFQKVTANDVFADRSSEPIAPGASYPDVGMSDPTVNFAEIAKQGGKFSITYEMKNRDQMGFVDQNIAKLVNTITRDTQKLAMNVLDAAISGDSRTASGQSWNTLAATTTAASTAAASIYADLASATMEPEVNEMPYTFDLAIVNPAQMKKLIALAGKDGIPGVTSQFEGFGIKNIWVTNRQTAGSVKFVATQAVGAREWEFAKGVQTQVIDQPLNDTFVVKGAESVMAYVTDPFAILELTGLAA